MSAKDDRPRSEQLRTQRGPFNSADLDPDRWLARMSVKHAEWERRNNFRKDWVK